MLWVGLTGGIGAGKSAVTGLLARRGAAVVDADLVAREVVAPGSDGLSAVVAEFGEQILAADGALDRPALGRLVFGDDARRRTLNALLHPRIAARTAELAAQAERDGASLLVHDVPLLVENGLEALHHLAVVVHAPREVRLQRLQGRGLPRADAEARMAAQATDAQRAEAADAVLDNGGTRAHLAEQVGRLWDGRLLPYAEGLRAQRPAARSGPVLVDPDPDWARQGRRLVARLRVLVPGAVDVQHIGSTAVPGLAAKDVVDLQVQVSRWQDAAALGQGGFPRCPGVDGLEEVRAAVDPDAEQWRTLLHLSADPGRAANVHVRLAGSTGARAAVALRDLLATDGGARAAYEADKRRLALLHPHDVQAYAQGKTRLLEPLLVRALRA